MVNAIGSVFRSKWEQSRIAPTIRILSAAARSEKMSRIYERLSLLSEGLQHSRSSHKLTCRSCLSPRLHVLTAIAEWTARLIWGLRSLPNAVFAAIAWGIIALGLWQVIAAGRETVRRSAMMHEIPCADCQFFTNDHRLKCPVHPHEALTPEAVGCRDFEMT